MMIIQILKFGLKTIFPRSVFNYTRRIYRKIRYYIIINKYGGDAVWCPCCNGRFSEFTDFDFKKTYFNQTLFLNTYKNKMCRNCFSLPRHRILAYYFTENRQKISPDKILMFSGEPVTVWFEANNYRYTTVDLFNRYADLKIDIQNIQFPDRTWSLIICNHILEHVQDYKKSLQELRRVLTDNGILALAVPTDRNLAETYEDAVIVNEDDRREKFGQNDHLRVFGGDFVAILTVSGFSVEIIDGNDLPVEIGPETGPASYDDNRVYICRKA